MKTYKKTVYLLMIFSFALLLGNCDIPEGKLNEVYAYPRELWGEWVRMDNGRNWYIASNYIDSSDYSSWNSYTFYRESPNVTRVTETPNSGSARTFYLFASRIPNSSFSATVVTDIENLIRSSVSGRSALGSAGNMTIPARNRVNPQESVTATTDDEGNVTFDDIIAGDDYELDIGGHTIVVRPNTDGEDVGTVTVTEGLNFSTSVTLQNANQYSTNTRDLMTLYTGDNRNYGIDIIVTNVGTATASMSSFVLDMPDGITFTGASQGMLGTIPPGASHTIQLRNLNYTRSLDDELEFKRMGIKITDPTKPDMAWDDSVSLRFNQEQVAFNVKAVGPTGQQGSINGTVIVPGGRTYHFDASGYGATQNARQVIVPRYTGGKGYLVVFSGATIGRESSFAFRVGADPENIPTDFIPENFYLTNTTENTAHPVAKGEEIRSFLGENTVRFFRVILEDD